MLDGRARQLSSGLDAFASLESGGNSGAAKTGGVLGFLLRLVFGSAGKRERDAAEDATD